MKLSVSNIAWEEKLDKEVYQLLKKYGFEGVEIAPTRWIAKEPYDHIAEAKTIAETLRDTYGYVVPSMQSIWFGKNMMIFANEEERQELLVYTQKAVDYASAIGCKNLVFGCPRNRNIDREWNLTKQQIDEIAIPFFKELGDYALAKGTVIGMEANPTIYNTNYINTTESALELIDKVASEGFLLNLDVGTMICNEESADSLKGKIHLINHVHISEPGLKPITDRPLHKELIDLLKAENYQKFVSIEMGKQEDITILDGVLAYVAALAK